MYELEIETKNSLKRIRNPRKAREKDLILRCVVQVMDGEGKWHLIGHCFFPSEASWAAGEINCAIRNREDSVYVDIS